MKLLAIITLATVATTAISISYNDVVEEEWNTFKSAHGKVYSSLSEEHFRMKVYMKNKAMIAKHNRLAHEGLHRYFLKMNHFGDLTHQEFDATMNGFRRDHKKNSTHDSGATFLKPEGFELPTEVDWRTKGAVTEVKNQGHCGSCWAFSATGSLEGQHFRKTGKLVSLSEQNLVDCVSEFNDGCQGGSPEEAFRYISENGGIDTEASYPYRANSLSFHEPCHFKKSAVGATVKSFSSISFSEDSLAVAVAAHGPISVVIDGSRKSLQFYHKGIYDDPECSTAWPNHAVLVVGYGPGYWLIKNSWSKKWGAEGYMKMKRGNNQCGITNDDIYPLV